MLATASPLSSNMKKLIILQDESVTGRRTAAPLLVSGGYLKWNCSFSVLYILFQQPVSITNMVKIWNEITVSRSESHEPKVHVSDCRNPLKSYVLILAPTLKPKPALQRRAKSTSWRQNLNNHRGESDYYSSHCFRPTITKTWEKKLKWGK